MVEFQSNGLALSRSSRVANEGSGNRSALSASDPRWIDVVPPVGAICAAVGCNAITTKIAPTPANVIANETRLPATFDFDDMLDSYLADDHTQKGISAQDGPAISNLETKSLTESAVKPDLRKLQQPAEHERRQVLVENGHAPDPTHAAGIYRPNTNETRGMQFEIVDGKVWQITRGRRQA